MASWVMPLFVIVAAVSLFIQMLIFAAMFMTIRRLGKRMEDVVDDLQRRVNPVLSRLQTLVEEAQPRISTMISDAAEITHLARNQLSFRKHTQKILAEDLANVLLAVAAL